MPHSEPRVDTDPRHLDATKTVPADREVPLPHAREDAPTAASDPAPLYEELRTVLARYTAEVDREIEAIEREQRRASVTVSSWSRLVSPIAKGDMAADDEVAGASGTYRLALETRWRSRRDERVVIKVMRADRLIAEYSGTVRATAPGGDVLDVQVRGTLSNAEPGLQVAVTVDSAWLERKLRDCLQAIADRPARLGPVRVSRALRTCGWTPLAVPSLDAWTPALPREGALLNDHPSFALLNEGQLEAVRRASGDSDASVVVGPPGTGKTTTLGAHSWQLVAQGERVLVLTPSNTAADLAAASIAQWCAEDPQRSALLARGLVQRWGAGTDGGSQAALSPKFMLARLADARSALLRDTAMWNGAHRVPRDPCVAAAADSVESIAAWASCPLPERLDPEHRSTALLADAARFRRAAERAIKAQCRVVVTTTVAPLCMGKRFRNFAPDALTVDEGSMVDGATLLVLASLARRRVTVFGDPRQLGPVLRATRTPLMSGGAMCSVTGERRRRRGETSELVDQYRMAPEICALVNAAFPGGVVMRTATERMRVERPAWLCHGSVVLVDTTPLNPVSRRGPAGSIETPVHADVVARMRRAFQVAVGPARPTVAVVTPYRAQCDALARAGVETGEVSTAHGWQGDEADVVFLCLDECSPGAAHFLSARGGGQAEGERLLYVGATRARHQLVVIAPVAHLVKAGSEATRSLLQELATSADAMTFGTVYHD